MSRASLVSVALAGGLLSPAACTVKGDYSGIGFQCSVDEPCPSDLECIQGTCQLPGSEIDASLPDASGDEPDAGSRLCLPPVALSDTFDGPDIDPQWSVSTAVGTGAAIVDTELALTPTSANSSRFARVQSAAFAFDGHRVFVELPQMVTIDAAAQVALSLRAADGNHVDILQLDGTLSLDVTVSGTTITISSASYDPAAQRWWQLSVAGGQLIAETSADGMSWNLLGMTSTSDLQGDLSVRIEAGTTSFLADPGELRVDNVNAGAGLCE
jgi:hypothetical protein